MAYYIIQLTSDGLLLNSFISLGISFKYLTAKAKSSTVLASALVRTAVQLGSEWTEKTASEANTYLKEAFLIMNKTDKEIIIQTSTDTVTGEVSFRYYKPPTVSSF